jgi:hypothetical protein
MKKEKYNTTLANPNFKRYPPNAQNSTVIGGTT